MRTLIGTRIGAAVVLAPYLGLLGCGGDDGTGPPSVVASVAITSALDTLLDVGGSSQLTATARDLAGNVVSSTFTWESSNPAVALVSPTGVTTAIAPGTAIITALARGTASGELNLRVLSADLPTIMTLSGDSFAGALLTALSAGTRPRVDAAWAACEGGASSGRLASVVECVGDIRAESGSATDPSDRALLAVLTLFANRIERLLGL